MKECIYNSGSSSGSGSGSGSTVGRFLGGSLAAAEGGLELVGVVVEVVQVAGSDGVALALGGGNASFGYIMVGVAQLQGLQGQGVVWLIVTHRVLVLVLYLFVVALGSIVILS